MIKLLHNSSIGCHIIYAALVFDNPFVSFSSCKGYRSTEKVPFQEENDVGVWLNLPGNLKNGVGLFPGQESEVKPWGRLLCLTKKTGVPDSTAIRERGEVSSPLTGNRKIYREEFEKYVYDGNK